MRPGLASGDIDYWEVNEAFSVVDLANRRLLGLDPARWARPAAPRWPVLLASMVAAPACHPDGLPEGLLGSGVSVAGALAQERAALSGRPGW